MAGGARTIIEMEFAGEPCTRKISGVTERHPAVRDRASHYRGTSLLRDHHLVGSYLPRVLGGSYGGGRFFMSKVNL